jgi:putative transposase
MENMVALPAYLALQTGDLGGGLFPVVAPFLRSGETPLRPHDLRRHPVEVARVLDEATLAVGDDVRHAAVERDRGASPARRFGGLQLADDAGKPLIAVANERARLWRALERAVDDDLQRAELREDQPVEAEAPNLRVWLTQPQRVAPLALVARTATQPLERALPRLVEFDQELCAHVARHVGQPRRLGAERRQLVDLVERRRVAPFVLRTREPDQALLVREVPEPAQGAFPRPKPCRLVGRRVDAEAEGLAHEHATTLAWSMGGASEFRTGRHVVYNLHAHLVFLPKYRRGVITPRVFDLLRAAWSGVCADFGCSLDEANFEPDHVHLLVTYPPKVALATLVNSLKGVSARRVRSANLPEVQRKLWGEHFWSPSYCAVSCGGAPLETVKRYIQAQSHDGASSSGPLFPAVNGGVSAASRKQKRGVR